MRKETLIILLALCSIFVVVFNLRYLQEIVKRSDLQKVEIDDKPILQELSLLPTKTTTKTTTTTTTTTNAQHVVAGLNCDKYGGPPPAVAKEMIYWRDVPSDATFTSPYAAINNNNNNYNGQPAPTRKFITFEPDEGGWNNIRMSMETAAVMAHAMGRVLVLPPEQQMYLLWHGKQKKQNRFTFKDFFHFDSIAMEHPSVEVISMEQFLNEQAMTGNMKDPEGKVTFPPNNQTKWELGHPKEGKRLFHWLRNATAAPLWNFEDCVVAFAKTPGPEGASQMKAYRKNVSQIKGWYTDEYTDHPTPVDADPQARLREQLGDRRQLCVYGDHFQNVPVIHFMGDNASGARLLTHFYVFLFFESWKQDVWTKRFVRDHLRYIDEIQCAAARVVDAVRQKAIQNGDTTNRGGVFDTFHIRRGDFQYKQTRVEAMQIYESVKDVLVENSTIFIATDERNMTFFDPLREHYHIYFLHDFQDQLVGLNKNFYGMLDQRIASRGRTFVGAFFSTFTGYINRMRGYHSQKDKLPGYEKGELNSYYYMPTKRKDAMRKYHSIKAPFWAREFPAGWRDIDHDL